MDVPKQIAPNQWPNNEPPSSVQAVAWPVLSKTWVENLLGRLPSLTALV